MSFSIRKIKADKLFDGEKFLFGKVVVLDNEGTVLQIDDAHFHEAEKFEGIIIPGLVNCHCHLELSHLEGVISKHTGLPSFLRQVMETRSFEEEQILGAIRKYDALMYSRGVVAVGDICNTGHSVLQKKNSKIKYCNFIEAIGFVPEAADKRFENAEKILSVFIENGLEAVVVPHAPYSVSGKLFEKINEFASDKIICIHNQETKEENNFFETKESGFIDFYKQLETDISFFLPSQKTSLQTYLFQLSSPRNILLVHNTFTSEKDVLFAEELAAKNEVEIFWVLCPNANLYIENTLPDVEIFLKNNCKIVIGTDSLASNEALDILAELKTLKKNFANVSIAQLLKMATLQGAQALGFSEFGKIEVGKKPGINLIDEELNFIKKII